MLRRTGRWWNRNRIWFYDEGPPEKPAAPPHPKSVRLSLLSPLLALVATVISLQSIRTSRQSLEVGNRAYLSIENTRVTASSSGYYLDDPHKHSLVVTSTMSVQNLGSTPGRITSFKARHHTPDGWKLPPHDAECYPLESCEQIIMPSLPRDVSPRSTL
jgi:hypothetical protein